VYFEEGKEFKIGCERFYREVREEGNSIFLEG